MDLIKSYLAKINFVPKINNYPSGNTGIIIVIPCFNEPNLLDTLNSLWNCQRPINETEIIIVINHSEDSSAAIKSQSEKILDETSNWITNHKDSSLSFQIIYEPSMPTKHAGVGLARKTGMDEAVYRFGLIQKHHGIIVGFDADSLCDTNYLTEIENHFLKYPKTPGASIYFEHPFDNPKFEASINEGIINYELHLRYLNQCIRYTGHPHSYHTIGSSFAVRADAYAKQGGMNKRQAGEDFYFIQKIISLGNYSEINTTRVIPSPRESDRVPFGTGAAITKWLAAGEKTFTTYNFNAFIALKSLFLVIDKFFNNEKTDYPKIISHLHPTLILFLETNDYKNEIQQIKLNTNNPVSFANRFFSWFNVFKIIKFLNASHNNDFKVLDVMIASKLWKDVCYPQYPNITEKDKMLVFYRNLERGKI